MFLPQHLRLEASNASHLQQLEGDWLKSTEAMQASLAGGAGVFTLDHHGISGSKQASTSLMPSAKPGATGTGTEDCPASDVTLW